MTLTENTTSASRRGAFPDRLLLPIRNEVHVRKYLPFELRERLRSRVLELTKLSMSYLQIQTEIFDSVHIWLSKGSITGRNLSITNTDLSLLLYVGKLLAKSGISTSIPHVMTRAGSILKDPHTGRTYRRRKDCFMMRVSPMDLLRFAREIGFSIEQKKRLLPSFFVDSFEILEGMVN